MSVYVESEKCTGCGTCTPICPVQAISIIQNKAVIDDNICTECLQCIEECEADAIYQIYEHNLIPGDYLRYCFHYNGIGNLF